MDHSNSLSNNKSLLNRYCPDLLDQNANLTVLHDGLLDLAM